MIDGWGLKGIITLIGFLGSLIAQQIRAKQKSYPFLEIVGEPGTGKINSNLFSMAFNRT